MEDIRRHLLEGRRRRSMAGRRRHSQSAAGRAPGALPPRTLYLVCLRRKTPVRLMLMSHTKLDSSCVSLYTGVYLCFVYSLGRG